MSLSELFRHGEVWPWLATAPGFWLILRTLGARRAARLREIAGPRADRLAAELDPRRRRRRALLVAVALGVTVLAAMGPVWGEGPVGATPRGADLVVAVDVSRSMLARDLRPSRLERARDEVRTLARRLRGDRLAVVAFAGEARLVAPLTRDGEAVSELATRLDPLSVGRGGTDLAAALETALAALSEAEGRAAVLLVTDGEDLAGAGLRAAEACAARGVVVHVVGLGSEQGSKIPIESEGGEVFLRDAEGREVVSALDVGGLRRIAEATGGAFRRAAEGEAVLAEIHEERILTELRRARDAERRRARILRYQWPLFLGLLLWCLDLATTDRRRE